MTPTCFLQRSPCSVLALSVVLGEGTLPAKQAALVTQHGYQAGWMDTSMTLQLKSLSLAALSLTGGQGWGR